jgi:hypothetical protein
MSSLQILIKLKKAKEVQTKKTPKVAAKNSDSELEVREGDALPKEPKVDDTSGSSLAVSDAAGAGKEGADVPLDDGAASNASTDAAGTLDGEGDEKGKEMEGQNPTDEDFVEEQVEEIPHWYQLRGD